jgi:hypothetical protein
MIKHPVKRHHKRGVLVIGAGIALLAALFAFGFVFSSPKNDAGSKTATTQEDISGLSNELDLLDAQNEEQDQKDLSELEEIISQ